ncbi:MAG: ribosome biogenesis GTP-binding protein YihA/YsxC [Haliscomenobacter sp.]
MEIHSAEFIGSFPGVKLCPKDELPEFAFIGRSNVGKSSLINMLCRQHGLAHISNKPGKTQLLNFYRIDQTWKLVDLPGYGYARVAKTQRKAWGKMVQDYLLQRPNLFCAFVLIDSNIPPQAIDIEFINWLGAKKIPFVLAFTKIDRIKPAELEGNIAAFQAKLGETWDELPPQFRTSAAKNQGREEILAFIASVTAQSLFNPS